METGLYIVLGLVAAYIIFIVWLVQGKRLEKWNLSLMLGVVLMVRTQRGKKTIDALARPKRLWNAIGDAGIALTLAGMVLITVFFLWSVWFVLQPESNVPALGATEIIVIPGVTPFVPLGYGLIALIVTLIVHEGGHGILARANNMKVKSVGLLVAVVPIGAFVEPDDLDMKVASRRQRLRVFGAGPAVNFGFAAIFLATFALLMGSLAPMSGAHVGATVAGGPAQEAGIAVGDSILHVRPDSPSAPWTKVEDWPALLVYVTQQTQPGDRVQFFLGDGATRTLTMSNLWDGLSPAQQNAITTNQSIGLALCRERLPEPDPATGAECFERLQGTSRMGIAAFQDSDFAPLEDPLGRNGRNLLFLFSMPLAEIGGGESMLNVYAPAFYHEPFHAQTFWVVANTAFWIFWINLAVGVTNILPMLPLDGGHIFRDAVGGIYQKVRPRLDSERREQLVAKTAVVMSLIILTAFLLQIFGPHLRNALNS